MYIRSLETRGFGNVPDGKLTFGEGLTIIQGPNEAGKSFTIKAIYLGLYGDAASDAKEVRELNRKWGSDGDYLVRLELESEGRSVILERDFGLRKNSLLDEKGIKKDKKVIEKHVKELVGLPSEKAFLATACIWQEEVEKLHEEAETLRSLLESSLTGAGKGTEKLLKDLEKRIEGLRSKSGKKGLLVELEQEIGELEGKCEEVRRSLQELADSKKRLSEVRTRLEEIKTALADKEEALERVRKYQDALRDKEEREREYERAREDLEKFRQARERRERCQEELAILEARIVALAERIGQVEEFVKVEARHGFLADECRKLEERIDRARELEKCIQKLEEELKELPPVETIRYERAVSLSNEIDSLRKALDSQLFEVEVETERELPFTITADGKQMGERRVRAHGEVLVRFPGVAFIRFKNLTGGERPLTEQLLEREREFQDLLTSQGVSDIDSLRLFVERRREKEMEIERHQAELRGHLGGEDLGELEASLREKKMELQILEEKKTSLARHALAAEALSEKKSEMAQLEKRKRELEDLIHVDLGTIKALGEDESRLKEREELCRRELAKAELRLEDLIMYRCDPEEYVRLEREVEGLRNELRGLEEEKIRLSERIAVEELGEEDLSELEERLAERKRRREALLHSYEIYRIILETLRQARKDTVAGLSRNIGDRMGEILSALTGGRYRRVVVDGELGIKVLSEEMGGFLDLGKKEHQALLSTGTLDQVYFAARMAVLEAITGDSKPPLILDDTFASFDDMGRKQNAFKLLEKIAEERQVLYFTCHECPPGLEVIRLR